MEKNQEGSFCREECQISEKKMAMEAMSGEQQNSILVFLTWQLVSQVFPICKNKTYENTEF